MAIDLADQIRRFRRAKTTLPLAAVAGAIGKGLQFGLMGKPPTDDKTDTRGPQMEALQAQMEAVTSQLEKAQGDPLKLAEARHKGLKLLLDIAAKEAGSERTAGTAGSKNRAQLTVSALQNKWAAIDRNLKTVDPTTRGGSGDAGAVNTEKVNTTFYRTLDQLSKSKTDTSPTDTIRATIASARLNPAERKELESRLVDSEEVSLSAAKRLEAIGGEEQQSSEEFISELMRPFEQDDAVAAQVVNSSDPTAAAESIPDPALRQRVKELTFESDPERPGEFLVDASGRPVLRKDAAAAAEYSATVQGIERQTAELMNQIQKVGAGQSDIRKHFDRALEAVGAPDLPSYFSLLGAGDMSEQQAAQLQELMTERRKLGEELSYAATRPTGLQGLKADIYRNPEFSAIRQQTGLSDRDALKTLTRLDRGKQREERQSRATRRKTLAQPRVTAALKEALFGKQGPQDV